MLQVLTTFTKIAAVLHAVLGMIFFYAVVLSSFINWEWHLPDIEMRHVRITVLVITHISLIISIIWEVMGDFDSDNDYDDDYYY